MKNPIAKVTGGVSEIFRNFHVNVTLEGRQAVIAIGLICGSAVAVAAINAAASSDPEQTEPLLMQSSKAA